MAIIKIKCLKCGEIIESTYRHHFKECSCGNICVDGGKDYLRFGGNIKDKKSYLFIKDGKEIKPEDMFIKNEQPVAPAKREVND
jgi:hypothetical protein